VLMVGLMPECGKRWTGSGSSAGGQIVVRSHLRFAAGVCVLAAGLLMVSAWVAIAVANADSSNSAAPGDGGANASRQVSTTASSPVGDVTDTQRKKIRRVTSTLGSADNRPAGVPGAKGAEARAWRHGIRTREKSRRAPSPRVRTSWHDLPD
jgi:hypothetical protein